MGWLFSHSWSSPSDVRDSLNRERGNLKLVAQKATNYGRHLWSVYETPEGDRFVNLDLMERGSDGSWGYKDMDETMGPFYYDCPLSLLKVAGPTKHDSARRWRDEVEARQARKSRKLTVGLRVDLYGKRYEVLEVKGRSYTVRREDGRIFKLTPKHVAALSIPEYA